MAIYDPRIDKCARQEGAAKVRIREDNDVELVREGCLGPLRIVEEFGVRRQIPQVER
jgi:hypothetical protein